MRLKDIGEFGFINKISPGCVVRPDKVIKDIGDDAAAYISDTGQITLVTTDLLIEQIHFIKNRISGFNLGHKALAVNLSDIAAMGGSPKEAFVSIAVPGNCKIEYLEELYNGIKTLAAEFNVNILGGDTTSSKTDLIISITIIGSVPKDEILFRHTAIPGDTVVTTGHLGDSRAGLHIIMNHIPADLPHLEQLLTCHFRPKPFIREGRFLAAQDGVHSAIDISDGLGSDLGHIVQQSNIGARLFADKIPISSNLKKFCSDFNFEAMEFALKGGEDYTLLCTLEKDKTEGIVNNYFIKFGKPLYVIGNVTDTGIIELTDKNNRTRRIEPSGWDHFR